MQRSEYLRRVPQAASPHHGTKLSSLNFGVLESLSLKMPLRPTDAENKHTLWAFSACSIWLCSWQNPAPKTLVVESLSSPPLHPCKKDHYTLVKRDSFNVPFQEDHNVNS